MAEGHRAAAAGASGHAQHRFRPAAQPRPHRLLNNAAEALQISRDLQQRPWLRAEQHEKCECMLRVRTSWMHACLLQSHHRARTPVRVTHPTCWRLRATPPSLGWAAARRARSSSSLEADAVALAAAAPAWPVALAVPTASRTLCVQCRQKTKGQTLVVTGGGGGGGGTRDPTA